MAKLSVVPRSINPFRPSIPPSNRSTNPLSLVWLSDVSGSHGKSTVVHGYHSLRRHPPRLGSPYVLHNEKGEPYDNVRIALNSAAKRAGIEE